MKKPQLLLTPTTVNELAPLISSGADAFVIGNRHFGLRLSGHFSNEMIQEATEIAHLSNKKIYVAVNAIFHNEDLPHLEKHLIFLEKIKVDAVIFGDPAVFRLAKNKNFKLRWDSETTATNYFSCNFWGNLGVDCSVLARELNLDEIMEICLMAQTKIEVLGHGRACMFQSKRRLIDNYRKFLGKDVVSCDDDFSFSLHDKERNLFYPIFQDFFGTHIMSPNDVSMIDELDKLVQAGVDYIKIDGILKDSAKILALTKIYRKGLDLALNRPSEYREKRHKLKEELQQVIPSEKLDNGFYFKELVY